MQGHLFYGATTHSGQTGEITAAIECLIYIEKHVDPTITTEISIFLDSSTTKYIMMGKTNRKLNTSLCNTLTEQWKTHKSKT